MFLKTLYILLLLPTSVQSGLVWKDEMSLFLEIQFPIGLSLSAVYA